MSAAASSGVPPRSPQGIPCPGGVGGRGASYQGPRHLGVVPFLQADVHAAGGIHNPPAPIRPLGPGGQTGAAGVPLRALGTWGLPLHRLVDILKSLLSVWERGPK